MKDNKNENRETNHLLSFITTPLSRLLKEMFFDFVPEFKYFLQLNLTMAWSQLFINKVILFDYEVVKMKDNNNERSFKVFHRSFIEICIFNYVYA